MLKSVSFLLITLSLLTPNTCWACDYAVTSAEEAEIWVVKNHPKASPAEKTQLAKQYIKDQDQRGAEWCAKMMQPEPSWWEKLLQRKSQ